jgi:hypothetical protein
MAPVANSSRSSSSDLYPASDHEQDGASRKTGHDFEVESKMDISGSETSSLDGTEYPVVEQKEEGHTRKRKAGDVDGPSEGVLEPRTLEHHDGLKRPDAKRPKPELSEGQPKSSESHGEKEREAVEFLYHGLTIPLWRKVLGHVPPVFLGRLLRVNRLFHVLLDCNSQFRESIQDVESDHAQDIWQASRKRFASGLPRNLEGQTDLELWRLLRGSGCQLCSKEDSLMTGSPSTDPWRSFPPFADNVRVVWPFGIRCCRECLVANCEQVCYLCCSLSLRFLIMHYQERNLLFSTQVPSSLLPALPIAFVTQHNNYVLSTTVKKQDCPSDIQIHKLYYKPHIRDIQERYKVAKDLGPGSTEEWLKGLEEEGRERILRITIWEQWDQKGGLRKVNARPSIRVRNASGNHNQPTATFSGPPHGSPAPHLTLRTGPGADALPARPVSRAPGQRHERTLEEVTQAKAARKAEIERRCAELDPPLTTNLLRHMQSFQAALVISQPLTERAWEVLKPRLLEQRQRAEDIEHGQSEQVTTLEAQPSGRKGQDVLHAEAESVVAAPTDEAQSNQISLHDKISNYADETIHNQWSDGQAVNKENCCTFAAHVLVYVRRRYYQGCPVHSATEEENSPRSGQISDKDGDEVLTLEHMKWVYENKIKHSTDPFRKELFLCRGCPGNSKTYGFEPVIQHYAAKHTTKLSQGSVVVHWRSAWPDPPPFEPDPPLGNGTVYVPTSTVGGQPHLQVSAPSNPVGTQGRSHNPHSAALGDSYQSAGYNGAPPGAYPTHLSHYHHQMAPNQQHSISSMHTGAPYSYSTGQQTPIQNASYGFSVAPGPFPNLASPQGQAPLYPNYNVPPHHQYGLYPHHLQGTGGSALDVQTYQSQVEYMAKEAREIWFAISGIKDLPQSVRIIVVIRHVARRFEQRYAHDPGLPMFLYGLDHNSQMRPVRSINGLACKMCAGESESTYGLGVSPNGHQASSQRRTYTLPHLLNHFKSAHLETSSSATNAHPGPRPSPDWKMDMITLPDTRTLTDLMYAAGMTDAKLHLVADVLPGIFPDPLPSLASLRSSGTHSSHQNIAYPSGTTTPNYGHSTYVVSASESVVGSQAQWPREFEPNDYPSNRGGSEATGDDEYDPHRPAYLGRIVEHHQITHPPRITDQDATDAYRPDSRDQQYSPQRSSTRDGHPHPDGGPYGSQLLRHHGKTIPRFSEHEASLGRVNHHHTNSSGNASGARSVDVPKTSITDDFLRSLGPNMNRLPLDPTDGRRSIPKRDENGSSQGVSISIGPQGRAVGPFPEAYAGGGERPESSRGPYRTESSHARVQYVYADTGQPLERTYRNDMAPRGHPEIVQISEHNSYVYDAHPQTSVGTSGEHGTYSESSRRPQEQDARDAQPYQRVVYEDPYDHLQSSMPNVVRHVGYVPVPPNDDYDRQYVVRYEPPPAQARTRYVYEDDNYPPKQVMLSHGQPQYSTPQYTDDTQRPHRVYR